MPLNIEGREHGSARRIARRVAGFLTDVEQLDLSPLL